MMTMPRLGRYQIRCDTPGCQSHATEEGSAIEAILSATIRDWQHMHQTDWCPQCCTVHRCEGKCRQLKLARDLKALSNGRFVCESCWLDDDTPTGERPTVLVRGGNDPQCQEGAHAN